MLHKNWRYASIGLLALLSVESTAKCVLVKPYGQSTTSFSRFDAHGQVRWTTEKWTKSDTPYRTIRLAIDKIIRGGSSPTKLASDYASAARTQPLDAKAQFRWAYAVYRAYLNAITDRFPTLQESRSLNAACAAMDKVAPQTREYTRLRFLLEVERLPVEMYQSVARRLIASDKDDNEVAYKSIKVLATSVAGLHEAVPLAQKLIKHEPNNANYHATLAGTYLFLGLQPGSSPSLKAKARDEYRRYLQLAPPNAFFRQRAQAMLTRLDQQLK